MSCYLCKSEETYLIGKCLPDKYQALVNNLSPRYWYQCGKCGLHFQHNGLGKSDLENIYLQYRNDDFRSTTVSEAYKNVADNPYSENQARINQLLADGALSKGCAVDIGSGFGVFPAGIRPYVHNVSCIEPNKNAAEFINETLGITCHQGSYAPGVFKRASLVTAIHVLEHMKDPLFFLMNIRMSDIKHDGIVYIEVPDADEFDYLPFNHDEFNSTHLYFFDISTLSRLAKLAGLEPYIIRKLHYPDRNLKRIYMLCRHQSH